MCHLIDQASVHFKKYPETITVLSKKKKAEANKLTVGIFLPLPD